ncbi:hypothetical protein H5410_014220 [Solanum commersonii]|uniref:Uncharacterized protein n=1 Tax=Solanum commersonii TaxID=4109 RepID=A0A9J5ZQQ6_SOLCO|nr:hypothetical protein H5410_014220 [Solanum commersonii]
MTPSEGNFLHKSPYTGLDRVLVRNGTLLNIDNIGYAQLSSKTRPLHLRSIFHIPQLRHNLLFVKRLCKDNNCFINFDSSSVSVKDKASGQTLLLASSKGDVYPLSSSSLSSSPQAFVALRQPGDIWHRRLESHSEDLSPSISISLPTTNSSTFTSANTSHAIQTRSKSGISKPKTMLSLSATFHDTEPLLFLTGSEKSQVATSYGRRV